MGRIYHEVGANTFHCDDSTRNECPFCKLEAENKALREALTPSAETKNAYWGNDELAFYDWTTIKEIMALIRKRALLEKGDG